MDRDEYENLVAWHRNTQKMLSSLQWMVGISFFVTVVAPMMKAMGLYNWLGWPDPFQLFVG